MDTIPPSIPDQLKLQEIETFLNLRHIIIEGRDTIEILQAAIPEELVLIYIQSFHYKKYYAITLDTKDYDQIINRRVPLEAFIKCINNARIALNLSPIAATDSGLRSITAYFKGSENIDFSRFLFYKVRIKSMTATGVEIRNLNLIYDLMASEPIESYEFVRPSNDSQIRSEPEFA